MTGFRPEDAASYAPAAPPPRRPSPRWLAIERCDAEVSILEVLREVGVPAPASVSYGWRVLCPWSDEHKDPTEPSMRVYEPTHVFCFDGHGQLRPSQLAARKWEMPRGRAAERLLDARGLLKPRDYRERWADLALERQTLTAPSQDATAVAQAVQTALAGEPAYAAAEFSEPVRLAWKAQLEALGTTPRTFEALSAWSQAALDAVRHAALTAVNARE